MRNYYGILEISEDASQEVIKAVYKALAKKYHPDCYSGDKKYAKKTMTQINEAYEVLSDKQKRAEYDRMLGYQKAKETKHEHVRNEEPQDIPEEPDITVDVPMDDMEEYEMSNNQENLGPIGRFFSGLGKHIINTIQENNKEINNAFIDGMNMDEYTLVRRFKQAKGNRRYGYAKALQEKGLLERNADGNFIPTYKFRLYL